ncbi:hypothetical protein FOL47_007373 [Perkinsus chesapeaki]|uniref:Uncharacterized protein n=1 Tax=Perkinsus chesapeaki TaxID=330153 RepID=A0A7J6LLL9_PERCH|nr:hypothetical protein FOL47_007373 [Perkinsus chesapeaki]
MASSDSGEPDYNDHPFTVLNVEDSILRLPFYLGEQYAEEENEDPRGAGLELSLMDIATGDRVIYPGRGNRCDHIDIVDLMNSVRPAHTLVDVETLELSPPWKCPRCERVYDCCSDLEVDEWIQKILQSTTDTSVRLYLDGSWADSAGLYVLGQEMEKIDLTSESADDSTSPSSKRQKLSRSTQATPEIDLAAGGNATASAEVIDLDSDDSVS